MSVMHSANGTLSCAFGVSELALSCYMVPLDHNCCYSLLLFSLLLYYCLASVPIF
jgi:hypothetical protein